VGFLSEPDTAISFGSFFDEHCASFADRKDDAQEQKLEWTQMHTGRKCTPEYQDMVDEKLSTRIWWMKIWVVLCSSTD